MKKNFLIMGGVAITLVLVISILCWFFYDSLVTNDNNKTTFTKDNFISMDEFVVDINSSIKGNYFLKIKIVLEVNDKKDVPKIIVMMPRIRDMFQSYIRSLRDYDIRGNAGIYRLKEELLLRVNKVTSPIIINDVLFSDIVILNS